MAEIYAVEAPNAPVHQDRFATFPGHEYSGYECVIFGPMSRVIRRGSNGVMAGDKPLSACMRIVDDLQDAVKRGSPQKWLASARVVKFLQATNQFEVVYTGKEQEAAHVEPDVPKCMLCQDGTYRVTPTSGFSKGPREWALSIAFVDSANVGRNDRFNGKTKLEAVTKLFESDRPWHREFVLSLRLADPKDVPAPPAPVVERFYTEAELAAVEPLDPKEWSIMPTAEHKRRYAFDAIYRARFHKMNAVEEERKRREEAKRARLTEEEELKKVREEFNKYDENEKLKGGIGTIL